MDPILLACVSLGLVFLLLMLRVPIAFALGFVAASGLFLLYGSSTGDEFDAQQGFVPMLSLLSSTTFEFVHNYPLSMIPLFIGLGHVAYRAGFTKDFYAALRIWFARLPGGLAMASIIGCGGFSAVTGSSVACASAMGRIAVPEMLRNNYHPALATGSVAVGGTLGSLIPPSILFVIYAIFAEQSVKVLFLAGILPGILSLAGYLLTTAILVNRKQELAPRIKISFKRKEKLLSLIKTWPVALLIIVVVGGIYGGYFTPTQAAAVSLSLAILIGILNHRLDFPALVESLRETVLQTATIFMIAMGAKLFAVFITVTQIAGAMFKWLEFSNFSMQFVLLFIVLLYIVLGMFLDSIGILVLTLPFVVAPDPGVWPGSHLVWCSRGQAVGNRAHYAAGGSQRICH